MCLSSPPSIRSTSMSISHAIRAWLMDRFDPEPRRLTEDWSYWVKAVSLRGQSTIVRWHSDSNQVSKTVRVNTDHSVAGALLQLLQLLTVAMMTVKALTERATMQLVVTPSPLHDAALVHSTNYFRLVSTGALCLEVASSWEQNNHLL